MRSLVILPLVMFIALAPVLAQASGCQSHSTVIGPVQPQKQLPTLPAGKGASTKGTPYALYWFFHTWCPSCQEQAGAIKIFQQRYGQAVKVYAVPLSGSDEEVKRFLSREGRNISWWEKYDTLVVAHCNVPWELVLGYNEPPERKQP